ncbi:MAG: GGDEF domain-containing protein [Lachnospiraceae bacterium]
MPPIISPLFFEDRAFGYIAMAFEKNRLNYNFKLVPFIMNITQLLSDLCDSKRTRLLTEHLETLYLRDVLTGLYNHHGFDQQKDQLLKSLAHYRYISALIFDLDMLKTINDRFGHEAGDFALKTIGQAIANASLEHDICARFSGDEFYCLLPSGREEAPVEFIRKVNLYLSHCNLMLNDRPYNVSTSSGFSTAPCSLCHTQEDIRKLFSQADEHMYENKKSKIKQVLKDMP